MNKTVNINLGGLFFHIDEDAFQKISRYFDAIKRSLSNANGQDEIMKDIEVRISEIFSENKKSDKHVINLKDVDAMIAIMGQPEDYRLEEENGESTQSFSASKSSKKLYRDIDKNILGGVAAGFGHYLGVDALWLRLALILLLFASAGTMIFVYILLWVLIPKAITTVEKLEMTGEPANLSNIEKKVREEFASFSEKVENADYEKMGNQVKSGAEEIGSTIGKLFLAIFNVFAKFLGAIIVIVSISTLAGLIVSVFIGTIFGQPWQEYVNAVITSEVPVWVLGLICFFAIGIPFFFLMILGLKLLITNMKSIGNIAKYSLLAIWIIAIALLITFGVRQASESAFDANSTQKEFFELNQNDTLFVKFQNNENFTSSVSRKYDFTFVEDENGEEKMFSNNVRFQINHTSENKPYYIIDKKADGNSLSNAKKRAENIDYKLLFENNTLILNNYFFTDIKQKYRDQRVTVRLYIPDGYYIKPDYTLNTSIEWYGSDMNFENGFDNKTYFVKDKKLKCVNCKEDDKSEENDSTSTTVTINKSGIQIKEGNSNDFKGLQINEDGVIIKN
ncbi:PspC domain-containing protein [Flavobacterium sp. UBA6135]|uniref:PspC domain-containing protein n=1 Tax=Flavobacterium sp. UBA6135 TaxID=1946553 RepID=UPI0025BEE18D|nr:PspC domain-containing protein [Flavobacterium sp. UBA6135]